jgi:hypothetical protein
MADRDGSAAICHNGLLSVCRLELANALAGALSDNAIFVISVPAKNQSFHGGLIAS